MISKSQRSAIFGYIVSLGISEEMRRDLTWAHTNGRTASLREMRWDEAESLIKYLTELSGNDANRLRKKMLAIAHQLGWTNNEKVDVKRVNNWCIKYGYMHKSFNHYTSKELIKLITQFKQLMPHG